MSQVVRDFYNGNPEHEWERLERPYRRLEYAGTMRLIDKYFPAAGRVADIGGGPGRYTIALLKRGYKVTLVDLSEGLLEIAKRECAGSGVKPEGIVWADACNLDFLETESMDAALLMGPLYHLVDPLDRARSLAELHRILKIGGIAIAAYINAWGLLRALLVESPGYFRDPERIQALTVGFSQVGVQTGFTEAYFTVPPKAKDELEEAGFELVSYAGVESFCSGALEPMKQIHDAEPTAYENIIRAAASLCEEPQFRDDTEHVHFVIRKSR